MIEARAIVERVTRWLAPHGSRRGRPARRASLWLALASALAAGCVGSHRLEPASGGRFAQASAGGFGVKAEGDAWTGASYTARHTIPIWVEVQNRSNVVVRVRHSDWVLAEEGASGYVAIAPRPRVGSLRDAARGRGLRVLHQRDGVPWQAGRQGLWVPNGSTAVMTGIPIRTWDMVTLALREGELHPGEKTGGFVYFPRALLRARRLRLTWLLHDSEDGALGAVSVQFRVRRGSANGPLSTGSDAEESGAEPYEGIILMPAPLPRPGDPIVPP
jgi:hypothetical protein